MPRRFSEQAPAILGGWGRFRGVVVGVAEPVPLVCCVGSVDYHGGCVGWMWVRSDWRFLMTIVLWAGGAAGGLRAY